MSRRRQQTASASTGRVQDAYGVRRRARQHSLMRNRRDPSQRPTSGEGDSYKPMAKGSRVGRESEGFIVLMTLAERSDEGRDPTLVMPVSGGKREGMVARPNHPIEKVRQLPCRLYIAAKCHQLGVSMLYDQPGGATNRQRPANARILEACMPHAKTIGKPDAGNLHVRFERGPQETEPVRHRA
jgi:hypothetical protein